MAPIYQNLGKAAQGMEGVTTLGGERVVISGMSGLYPQSKSIQDLSNILYKKVNPIVENNRLQSKLHCHQPEASRCFGEIPGFNDFDSQFFNVPYRLANIMDPNSRKLLEQTHQAIFDAGLSPQYFSGKNVAVYAANCFSDTEKTCYYDTSSNSNLGIVGCSKTMYANRISYWLNTKGPSLTIDDEGCSGIAALEQAYLAIRSGNCEAAIVGSCNLYLHPHQISEFEQIVPISANGKPRSFDENADGLVMAEAINVLVLQRARDALRNYAEIFHVKTEFISLPVGETGPKFGFYRNPHIMAEFIQRFFKETNVSPHAVEYVEALGVGEPSADKAELEALDEVYCKNRKEPLLVGSVTSNIGYTASASGISGITKVLLGFHTGILAGNLHLDSPRQDVDAVREGRLRVLNDHHPCRRTYATVNGISITGINAHVLLRGCYKPKDLTRYVSSIPHLVTISGRQETAIMRVINDLKSRSIDPEEIALLHNIHKNRIASHLARGFTILGTNAEQNTVSLCEKSVYYDDTQRPLWFVYSGMGSQWAGMGVQLMRIPIFAAAVERCHKVLEPKGIDIVHIITSPDKTMFDNILHSFVGIATIQIGLTDILRELDLKPDKILGHSVGELGCAYADGCLTAEEMILSAYSRGLVSLQTPLIRGSMAAVALGYQQITKVCPPEIDVACHNGPESCTISGPADIMQEFVAKLSAMGIFAKEVPCSNIAYHSRYIAKAGPVLLEYLKDVIKSPKARSERWISTSIPQQKWNEPAAKLCSAEYHTNNLLNPVLFEEASRLIPSNAVVVEVAPHGLLQSILKRSLPAGCVNIALTRRGHNENVLLLLQAIGELYTQGYTPKIHALYPKVEFPVSTETPSLSHLVEWAHIEKWASANYVSPVRRTTAACTFVYSYHDEEYSYLKEHVIRGKALFPFAGVLVAVWDTLAMSTQAAKKGCSVGFKDVRLHAQPTLYDQRPLRLSVTLQPSGQFEVMNENFKVATGYIFRIASLKQMTLKQSEKLVNEQLLTKKDIYELLAQRDYHYGGEFQSILSTNVSLSAGRVAWRGSWVTLLDALLQLNALKQSHDSVSQPVYIRKLFIDPMHFIRNKITTSRNTVIDVNLNELEELTRCEGITIEHIRFRHLPAIREHTLNLSPKYSYQRKFQKEQKSSSEDQYLSLRIAQHGELNTLHWIEDPIIYGSGIKVKVHYAGINNHDVKKATGITSLMHENGLKTAACYGMDFSGTTESGDRVMGIVAEGACSTHVRALPDLLWPVPAHWSLEDAATVPLAYAHAFYCLGIKSSLCHSMSVLVHGGSGALGQAAISIALGVGCQVFTTVSDVSKKRFLLKLFPELNEQHIGNSRDHSFGDMVLGATNRRGCDIVICCEKGAQRNTLLKCCAVFGITFDTFPIRNQECYSFGMECLNLERSYYSIDFSSIASNQNIQEMQALQVLVSEGIACGYVRPLTRVTYAPHEASRAFRLLATSQHRGRALLRLHDFLPPARPRLTCNPDLCHVLLSNQDPCALQLADRLVSCGTRKLYLHYENPQPLIEYKLRSWEKLDVQVQVSSDKLTESKDVANLLKDAIKLGPIEGIYFVALNVADKTANDTTSLLTDLDLVSRQCCPSLKYFGVFTTDEGVGARTCSDRAHDVLPATALCLPFVKNTNNADVSMKGQTTWYIEVVDAMEMSLCSPHPVLVAQQQPIKPRSSLHQLAASVGITMSENLIDKNVTLGDLSVDPAKAEIISALLRDNHNICLDANDIPCLSVKKLRDLLNYEAESTYEVKKGIGQFFSYVESDELEATDEVIFLPTLTCDATMSVDEFDKSQAALFIVPGLEGHYERFRALCERLKLPAIVLQPELDRPHKSIHELAHRYTQVISKTVVLNKEFYLLGFESGVLVAMEIAAILESQGLTGTVFQVGYGPEEFQAVLEEQLKEYETEEQLKDAILWHIHALLSKDTPTKLATTTGGTSSWKEKVDECVRSLLGRVPHSAQFVRSLIECAVARVLQARHHGAAPRPAGPALRSRLVLLRAAAPRAPRTPRHRPVAVHDLTAPLSHCTSDMRCASIINKYLSDDILQQFENRNLCENYLVEGSGDIIMGHTS